jgi:GMP synthase (glutamine-hydrolysing)
MKIGLLNCYHWDGVPSSYQAQYRILWENYLSPLFPDNWALQVYELPIGEFPSQLDDCDGWIIGGSGKSWYEQDGWILKLGRLIEQLHAQHAALLGICFGHQMIANTLGGKVEKSNKGWGIGVRSFQFEKLPTWYDGDLTAHMTDTKLIFSHQDQVVALPPGADRLATDPFCPVQAYVIGEHILSLQGHPEFTPEFADARLIEREGRIGKQVCDQARASLARETQAAELGDMIIQFFHNAQRRQQQ